MYVFFLTSAVRNLPFSHHSLLVLCYRVSPWPRSFCQMLCSQTIDWPFLVMDDMSMVLPLLYEASLTGLIDSSRHFFFFFRERDSSSECSSMHSSSNLHCQIKLVTLTFPLNQWQLIWLLGFKQQSSCHYWSHSINTHRTTHHMPNHCS